MEFFFPAPDPDDVPMILSQESPAPSEPHVTIPTVPEEDPILVSELQIITYRD
jgi:hypothetical protein